MADRRVLGTGKDKNGDITSLCNPRDWGKRTKADAIRDIQTNTHTYFVHEVEPPVLVEVAYRQGQPYLHTRADRTSKNNLDNLPNC